MDFPVCPSCKQSVIDDDAENCPFCGSSMKAKPGSTATKAPAAANRIPEPPLKLPPPTKPLASGAAAVNGAKSSTAGGGTTGTGAAVATATPAAGPTGTARPGSPAGAPRPGVAAPGRPGIPAATGRPGTPAGAADAEETPFDMDEGAKKAIKAAPKPVKGRSHKVVCPMCETEGFIPKSAAGHNVRCANPDCKFPIFESPKLVVATKVEAPPPPKRRLSIISLGIITTLLVSAGGGAAYYFASQPNIRQIRTVNPSDIPREDDGNGPPSTAGTPREVQEPTTKLALNAVPEDWAAQWLKLTNEAWRQEAKFNRSIPYCRQQRAEGLAILGRTDEAKTELKELDPLIRDGLQHYAFDPRIEIGWKLIRQKKDQGAQEQANFLEKNYSQLPRVGRKRFETCSRLAAFFIAKGKPEIARQILDEHQSDKTEGQLAAMLVCAQEARKPNLGRWQLIQPVVPWSNPQTMSTAFSVAARDNERDALNWAKALTIPDRQREAVTGWAMAVAMVTGNRADEIGRVAESWDDAQASQLLARAGLAAWFADRKELATDLLNRATLRVDQLSPPPAMAMPTDKQLYKFKPTDLAPLRAGAIASIEVARLQTALGNPSAAVTLFDQAISFLKAMSPPPDQVRARLDQANAIGRDGRRELVKREWNLKKDDDIKNGASDYVKALNQLEQAAATRKDILAAVLLRAAEVGLTDAVYARLELTSGESATEPEPVPPEVFAELIQRPDFAAQKAKLEAMYARAQPNVGEEPRPSLTALRVAAQAGAWERVGQILSQCDDRNFETDWFALVTAGEIAAIAPPGHTLQLLARIDDQPLREDCERFAAAALAQRGDDEAGFVWKWAKDLPQATERISVLRGFVAGYRPKPGAANP